MTVNYHHNLQNKEAQKLPYLVYFGFYSLFLWFVICLNFLLKFLANYNLYSPINLKIMKKLKKISSICALIFCVNLSSQAFAKTEGSYVGVNIADFTSDNNMKVSENFVQVGSQDQFKKSSTGVGLEYKYAYNFNGLFVAPAVFFDFTRNDAQNAASDNINLENRYGVKFDIGFDIADKFSPYLTIGYAGTSYDASVLRVVNSSYVRLNSAGREFAPIYGFGFLFDLNEKVKFNFEFNHQSIEIPLSSAVGYNHSKTDLTSAKFGVLFNF
jgi:opacity protein-like surface antigen